MKARPLAGFQVLDLTHRLPGPTAGHLLKEMGATVIKVEDESFGDPFLDGFFKEMDPSFSLWYRALNEGKDIQRFSLKENVTRLQEIADKSDIILMGLPPKLQKAYELDFDSQRNRRSKNHSKKPFALIHMTASHDLKKGMHDLNALASQRLLDLHVWEMEQQGNQNTIAPPFLPIAGIGYGAILANQALANLLKANFNGEAVEETISLEESVKALWSPFYDEALQKSGQKRFLHNGRYPCYNIYRLKDHGHLAVASLEPKYWQRFCELLELPLSLEERFALIDTPEGKKVFETITLTCSLLSLKEAQRIFGKGDQDCCVDIINPS